MTSSAEQESQDLSSEPRFTMENLGDLFGSQIHWLVDETSVYRVRIYKSDTDALATQPINGAAFVFNAKTGQLFLKIIHSSAWAGQARLGQMAKWKAADEVAALIRALPTDERPAQIVLSKAAMLDVLRTLLADLPDVGAKVSAMQLPFQGLLKVDKLADLINNATEPQMVLFNLYDDWLRAVSPYTAFARLVLVLRALHANSEQAWAILKQRAPASDTTTTATAATELHHIWPSLHDEQWIMVERGLRDLILADYGARNQVSVTTLTSAEVRDIIFGNVAERPPATL